MDDGIVMAVASLAHFPTRNSFDDSSLKPEPFETVPPVPATFTTMRTPPLFSRKPLKSRLFRDDEN
jgi:hypothetical protein